MEITTVSNDEVVLFNDGALRSFGGLQPGRLYEFDGVEVETLDAPGELLSTFGTVNDVHFGETICGVVGGTDIGPTFQSEPGAEPYPEVMNRGAIAELKAMAPEVVLVKGDLTSTGSVEEFQRFLAFYEKAFADRLYYVRGNHESYNGSEFATTSYQAVHVEGAVLAMLDTSRLQQVNGSLSDDQIEWLDELAENADVPVLVFGHHPAWCPDIDPRSDTFFGLRPSDSEALFDVVGRRRNILGYFAGHTHRNRRVRIDEAESVSFVEVACVKDFPGAVAEYRVFDGGIMQVFRRISAPDALEWSEKTRGMYEGGYGAYAFGRLSERCFVLPLRK